MLKPTFRTIILGSLTIICASSFLFFSIQPSQVQSDSLLDGSTIIDPPTGVTETPSTEAPDTYTLLEPLPGLSVVPADFVFADYVNIMIQIITGIITLVAVVMIFIAGLQYMTTDAWSEKSNAKEMIFNALGGLIIALAIFVILNTINPQLTRINLGLQAINIQGANYSGPPREKSDGTYANQSKRYKGCSAAITLPGYLTGSIPRNGDDWPSDTYSSAFLVTSIPSDLTSDFMYSGINVNSLEKTDGICKKVGQKKCTSLYFEPGTLVTVKTRLESLYNQCKAADPACANEFTITGGSECWLHSTHGPFDTSIDIRSKSPSQLNNILNGSSSSSTSYPSNGCKPIRNPAPGILLAVPEDGSCSWKPAPHWHVVFE